MFSQSRLLAVLNKPDCDGSLVQDVMALLAYPEPAGSPVGYLLQESFRDRVGDAVNNLVLNMQAQDKVSQLPDTPLLDAYTAAQALSSALERNLSQVWTMHRILREDGTSRDNQFNFYEVAP